MIARIPVRFTANVNGEALVDSADLPLLEGFEWHFSGGYACARRGGETFFLHRLLFGLRRGDDQKVDHINGNTLDNRRENLRVCTQAQNAQNQHRGGSGGRSQFRGVVLTPNGRKWQARGRKDGKNVYLGTFTHELDAAEAARAHREIHMPFATQFEQAA